VVDEHGVHWHRTGSVARSDASGGLWLLGTVGTALRVAGTTMYALELESPVADLPEVARAVVCVPRFQGAEREFKNASGVLAVEPAPGFSRAEARAAALACLRRLGADASIELRTVRRIPMEGRRGTRVDHAALEQGLQPGNTDDY
jgi:acyl-coenzyme A synthetase/AMP-(fatty) acid ligase